jgi:serine phosphatase RsbU (regulator of sigma subunit)
MEFARQVQTRLFPQKLPAMKTLEYTGACLQARKVGGDYYDFLELRPGRLALVLADIAGKGVSGALLMANLQANLRSQYAMAVDDLPQLLASVNRLFYESTDEASYATLFFADYDDSSRKLRYANCGHLPPLLRRACKGSSQAHISEAAKVEWLRSTCTVMGLFEDWRCEIAEVRLAPGDTLVLLPTRTGKSLASPICSIPLGGILIFRWDPFSKQLSARSSNSAVVANSRMTSQQ